MSFSPCVPCNCRKEGKTNYPPFKDKLTIRDGVLDLAQEFYFDRELEKKYNKWKFCEHNQVAIEFSMAQSISGWRKSVQDDFPNRFPNFENFIPLYNDVSFHNYDKKQTILEIKELDKLYEGKYSERFQQFIQLLEKAIELDQKIYW